MEAGGYPGAMELTVLGCSGTYPVAGRPASGYLVSHQETTLWVEAGPGTFTALCGLMDPHRLDGVFLSHRHPDHCADFFALYHALAYGGYEGGPLPVICPPGLADLLSGFAGGAAMRETFSFTEGTEDGELEIGGLRITTAPANHPPPTLAARFSASGRSLAYTADTGPSREVEEMAAGCDLLLAEAALQEPRRPEFPAHHMTGREAGEMASRAGARRLMLTHLRPRMHPERTMLEAEAAFAGEVSLAAPGAKVRI